MAEIEEEFMQAPLAVNRRAALYDAKQQGRNRVILRGIESLHCDA